jgi:galactokinase
MPIHLSLPGRVNILGNPSDGNEGDFATISAAVELRAFAEIGPADGIILQQTDSLDPVPFHFTPSNLPFDYNGEHDLLKGAINRLYRYSPEFREKLHNSGFKITVHSDVPRQSGLGGSSLFVLLALAGLREYYQLDRCHLNDYVISELTQRVEAKELLITAGYADRYVPLFGGLAYIDYRGKLQQKDIHTEPYAVYERLDQCVPWLPLVAVSTGVRHNSGDVHGRMRPRYLEEHTTWEKCGGDVPPMVCFMSEAWECAWKGKIALLGGEMAAFGRLMTRNHAVVDEMMHYCGFEDGAGRENNLFIETALNNGALGAKLTGAGAGGSVFALVNPGDEERLMQVWRQLAEENDLKDAQIFQLAIAKQGLVVTHS